MQGLKSLLPLNKRIETENEVVEDLLYMLSERLDALNVFINLSASLLEACSEVFMSSAKFIELVTDSILE